MSKMFNMAVVGCGAMARQTHLPNILRHPEISLRWCCDRDENILRQTAGKFSPEKTAKDIKDIAGDPDCDAALLATHPEGRLELIKILASSGKHIYAEKPLADNMDDMLEIQRIVEESGVVLTVGHNRRKAPAMLEARNIFNKHRQNPVSEPWRWDRIGGARPLTKQDEQTLILIRINDDYYSWKEWCYGEDAGILLLEINHFTDLAHYFLGTEPVSVSATGDAMMNVVLNMRFECGSICTIFDACVGSFAYPKELYEIYHKGGVIAVDHCLEVRTAGIPGEPFRRLYPSGADPTSAGIESWHTRVIEQMRRHNDPSAPLAAPDPDKGHYEILDGFMRACRDGEENPCDAAAGSRAAAIVIKAAESLARDGAPQKIEKGEYLKR